MTIQYRREIDGLRAIAVGAVVLYHAGVGGAGFVGVDVFFVISGYLITALLLREHGTTGRMDLMAFYARRARRILPAGLLVVLVTLGGGVALLPAPDVREMAASAAAAAAFVANVFFQSATGGYFHGDAARMPLLHLWSLSVEEQFYLAWPLLLITLARRPGRIVIALAGLSLASFLLAEWLMRSSTEAAFYQTPARFWELAAGGMVAVLPRRRMAVWLPWAGLVVILAACVAPIDHFPGFGALLPVLGTAAILAAIHGGGTNPLLASQPMVGLGLISYSLYLWHWPLLALYRATVVGDGDQAVKLQLCALAVLLAAGTYRYVETPFRRGRLGSLRTVGTAGSVCAAVAIASLLLAQAPAAPLASTPGERAAADRDVDFLMRCEYQLMESLESFPRRGCEPDARARLVIWGDSMAAAWAPAVRLRDARAAAFTRSGCPPLVGYEVSFRARVIAELCTGFNDKVLAAARGDTLVLAARWRQYENFDPALEATLAAVAPRFRRVVLIGAAPEIRDSAPHCLNLPDPESCSVTLVEIEPWRRPLERRLRLISAKFSNVAYFDPADFLCRDGRCPVVRDGAALYTDATHVSASAARAYGRIADL